MRPGNTALLVIAATGVDQHVEAVDVQQVAAYLDAKNRGLRIHREFIAPVPAAQRPQVFAGHTRNGELHGHAAFALANALDLKLAQVSLHDVFAPSRGIIIAHANCRVTGITLAAVAQGFDYIVVGGGTAGCALAARLSEDGERSVCLLEAGGSGRSVFINVPGTIVMAQRSAALNWRFQTVPQRELGGRCISVPRGRGLGGSALINGMVYFRGNPRDYDAWAAAGATGWSYREVLPYFRKSEHNENFGASVYHGRGGPMNVRSVTRPNPLNFSFFDALASLGYSYRDDLNGADSEGMALRQLSIRGGRRETTANAFLQPALGRANLSVLTETQATRIVLNARRAVAVEARSAGTSLTVKAHREIVLTAGAIQSPQLLMLSGIGDGEHLAALGIALRHELPAVGRNLHDHLA